MIADLLLAFFLTRENPHHQQTGLLLFRGERAPRKRQASTAYMCSRFDAYALSYAASMIIVSCRKKSLIKDRRIVKVLLSLVSKFLHQIPF